MTPGFYYLIVNRWSEVVEGQLYHDLSSAQFWLARLPNPKDYTLVYTQVIDHAPTEPKHDRPTNSSQKIPRTGKARPGRSKYPSRKSA